MGDPLAELDAILDRRAGERRLQGLSVRLVEIILDPINVKHPHHVIVHVEPPNKGPLWFPFATRAEAQAAANRYFHGELLELVPQTKEPPK